MRLARTPTESSDETKHRSVGSSPALARSCTLNEVNRLKIWAGVLALAASVACSRVPPLANTHPSPSSLASAVLDALARRDRAALEALALNETEFRDHVWPQLPASRPERNLPFSYVWGELRQKSAQALTVVMSREGGKRYELIDSPICRRHATIEPIAYIARPRFMCATARGMELDLRVCGSMLEQDGAWKVFSYVVDD